ncbi:MAG: AAA family ATPase, partial [Bradymonadaceae bacterium]
AGMQLARDVAGYDFDAGENPKEVNPILFGLGPPGSGKTITAHAVGNYFLDFCNKHDVPARFRVVRRTDWASSYQNASARNLVEIFRQEVYEFDGVCGVYWPDIDTAFASRSSDGLRMEEKQNLGAVFGIFDGTLLPQDGKWFLICDANTLHMDDATVSRIAQNPLRVEGPTEPDHYVELMRDIQLEGLDPFVPDGDDTWRGIGERAAELGMTGRDVEAVCRQIRSRIQDFDYPDRYFEADPDQRREIVHELSNAVDTDTILRELDEWDDFHGDSEYKDEEKFQKEVDAIVERLNTTPASQES